MRTTRGILLALALAAGTWACGSGGTAGTDPGTGADTVDRDVPGPDDATSGDPAATDQPSDGDEGPDAPGPLDPGTPPADVVDDAAPDAAPDPGGPLDPGGPADPGPQDFGPAYHPEGWADPAAHGQAFNAGAEDCRTCHGDALEGQGHAPSCNACHVGGWQSSCTFCHGGTDNSTGAPPRDLDGAVVPDALSFRAHTAHVTATRHPAYDCTQCHVRPAILLSEGHLFDATPGVAEVAFHNLSDAATRGAGTCANLYCHGNGQGDNGQAGDADSTPACSGCHPDRTSGEGAWGAMSGEHSKHLRKGLECGDCHTETATGSTGIANPDLHVNGKVEAKMPGITLSLGRCTGSCHGELHLAAGW